MALAFLKVHYNNPNYQLLFTGNNMAMTAIKLDDKLGERVKSLAKIRKRSTHWILCEAVERYIEQEEAIENLKEEARRSWNSFQETGLHLTLDETRTWLNTWGTDKTMEMPKCHE